MPSGIAVPIAAGLAIGIAFVILFVFVDASLIESSIGVFTLEGRDHFRPDRYEHVSISIEGLNDRYAAGEPIIFSAHFIGFTPKCDASPSIKIIHTSSDKIVYLYDPFVVSLCSVGDFVDDTVTSAELNEEAGDLFVFREGGEYRMIVEQYGERAEKRFVVVRADSGVGVHAEVLDENYVDNAMDSIDVIIFDHELDLGIREQQDHND